MEEKTGERNLLGRNPASEDGGGGISPRKTDGRYQTFFELMNEGAIAIDDAGRIVLCNPCFAMMMRESIDHLQANCFFDHVATDNRERLLQTLRRGASETYESVLISRYGEKLPVLLSLTPVVEIDRSMTYIVVTDLREHRANLEALQKSKEFSAATLSSIHAGIAVLDRDGTIVAVNKSWHDSGPHNKVGEGDNYISVWANAVKASHPYAQEAIEGIKAVLSGDLSDFRLDYPGTPSDEARWFTMVVTPLGADRRGVVVSNSEITDRKRAEEEIKKALDEKSMLLRELYHRTKNNMSVVIALLSMQSSKFEDQQMIQAFSDAENRIMSMALVHEKLYEARDLTQIDLREYIEDLLSLLVSSYQVTVRHLKTSLELDKVFLQIESAIPCGLIVTELISNALKHAFEEKAPGEIKIGLLKDDESVIHLCVQDNGRGVPVGFDFRRDGNLGLQTIFHLGESQLNGTVEFRSEEGVECRLSFKV